MENKQRYTSKATSINSTKAPAIVGKLRKLDMLPDGVTVIDYGAGRFPDVTRQALELDSAHYFPYDPYNLPDAVNERLAIPASVGGADVVMCSNVLNVIDSDDVVRGIMTACCCLAKAGGIACFTVYEGDKSGKGRATGADQYQRNEKRSAYKRFLEGFHGVEVYDRAGMIVVKRCW